MDVTGVKSGAEAAKAVGITAKVIGVLSVVAIVTFIWANWYTGKKTKLEITKLEKDLGIQPSFLV